MSGWVDVAPRESFEPGSFRVLKLDDVSVVVFNADGDFYAIEDLCTHDCQPLSDGILNGCEIMCARHGAVFDLRTGEALTPPAYEPVETFPVRVENGTVQVRNHPAD